MEKIPILLMFLGHIWVDTSQGILPVVLPKLKEVLDLNYFEIGLVVTVLNLTSSVIQPIFGYISDKIRTGWFVPVGILWTACMMGFLGWAPGYLSVLLLVGFAGLGTAAFHPRAMMVVHLVSGSRKGLGTAIFSTAGNLGFALGPMVGSLLVLGFGLHATIGLLGPGVLLALIIFLCRGDFLSREAPGKVKARTEGDGLHSILWGSLILTCLVVTLRSWVYLSFMTYLPLFAQEQGLPLTTGSLMLTVFLVGGAVAGLYGGHLSDRVGRSRVIVVSMLLYPIFMSLMILSSGPIIWVLAAASGAALLASFSVTIVLAQELLPRNLGLASGLILGLGFGMGGLGAAVSGWIADMIGLYKTVWILALVPMLGAVIGAFIRTPSLAPSGHR